jgi:hypothetical protein
MYGGFEAEALQNFVHAFRLGAILLGLVSTLSKLFILVSVGCQNKLLA